MQLPCNYLVAECLLGGRAVVLGALGQHRQALQLYVSQLHDLPAALAYCSAHYRGVGAASQVLCFAVMCCTVMCCDVLYCAVMYCTVL
jgi:hypothetical protein